jgi:hypothetical protein
VDVVLVVAVPAAEAVFEVDHAGLAFDWELQQREWPVERWVHAGREGQYPDGYVGSLDGRLQMV